MNILDNRYSLSKILLISFIGTVLILYTDIICIPWRLDYMKGAERPAYLWMMGFRFCYFLVLLFFLVKVNLHKINTDSFKKRLFFNALFCLVAYGICVLILFVCFSIAYHFGTLLFLFLLACILSALLGHIFRLYSLQLKKDNEIEQLKVESLESRCEALANQINPHFFFNSLNGLTALIRKKNNDITLEYVSKLSDVFRYILQSNKKGLVTLEEELDFVQSFRYTMEVRFANKLNFDIEINQAMLNCKLPVLSILPIIDNIIVHNMIDSEHKMTVVIRLNEKMELVVSNPVYPKLSPPETKGTGLRNLKNRFHLLMDKQIRIKHGGDMFFVYLPLIE